ncbi:MAG: hypothetical protein OXB88_07670 [Bacteriovoracales bacterium]|nr:hypothetical protein [Bacteriovoracales bacterium]
MPEQTKASRIIRSLANAFAHELGNAIVPLCHQCEKIEKGKRLGNKEMGVILKASKRIEEVLIKFRSSDNLALLEKNMAHNSPQRWAEGLPPYPTKR